MAENDNINNPDGADDQKQSIDVTRTPEYQELESRYKGLQRSHQKKVEAFTELEERFSSTTADLEELRQSTVTYEKSVADLTKQLENAGALKTDFETKIDELNKNLERKSLFMSEFPGLVEFESQGLFSDKVGDDLKTALSTFQESLNKRSKSEAETMLKTSSHKEPPKDQTPSINADEAYQMMMKYAGKNNDEFIKYRDIYDNLTKKQE